MHGLYFTWYIYEKAHIPRNICIDAIKLGIYCLIYGGVILWCFVVFCGVNVAENQEFANFVQKIRTISSETDCGEFLRGLLFKIGPKHNEDFTQKVINCPASTLRQYFNGQTGISGPFFDFEYDKPGFRAYLNDLSDENAIFLADQFKEEIPEINAINLADTLSDKLGTILAARKKREPRKYKPPQKINKQLFLNFDKPNQDNQYQLTREAMNHCLYPHCSKRFYNSDNPTAGPLCEVVFIDENASNKDDISNLAVMCPECAMKYRSGHSAEIEEELKKRKKFFLQDFNAQNRLSEIKLTKGAEILFRNIQNLSADIIVKYPETEPTDIRNKIKPEYSILVCEIAPLSSSYFKIIEDIQKNLEMTGDLNFDDFKNSVHTAYCAESCRTENQSDIFENLAQWLRGTTNVELIICKAVLSYFVQICEVFDDLSK